MIQFLKEHKLLVTLALVVIIAAAVSVFLFRNRNDNTNAMTVKRGSIIEAVYGIGTVEAWKTVQLKTGVPSSIRTLFVEEGDFVEKGAKLVELDGFRVFVAPFSGSVTSLPYRAGDTIFPQVSFLTLTDFQDRYLVVSLEQQGAIRVKKGQAVKLNFDGLRNQTFDGKVEAVYSNADRFLVRIAAHQLPMAILPGMTADVSITIQTHQNVLLVPIAAITLGKVRLQKKGLGGATEVTIQTGVVNGNMAQVVSGDLHEGDSVLVSKE